MNPQARAIAMYLPQFHPIRENNEWWGPGFTEWVNVVKARPLYPGHDQPRMPADLGFYDLRLPETRQAQATLAHEHGIEAFCYYHYWFAGRELLERPFDEVLASGEPDFSFCLCWANQTWAGTWQGGTNRTLVEQTYPGASDHRAHFEKLLPAFFDRRYVRVDNKPVFIIYRPLDLPDSQATLELWRKLAQQAGLPGLYLIGQSYDPQFKPHKLGYDASIFARTRASLTRNLNLTQLATAALRRGPSKLRVIPYQVVLNTFITDPLPGVTCHPCILPNWDNSPRHGRRGHIYHNSTPELFRTIVRRGIARARHEQPGRQFLFLKSWNEWAEGNYLEPDTKWGNDYLVVLREELLTSNVRTNTKEQEAARA